VQKRSLAVVAPRRQQGGCQTEDCGERQPQARHRSVPGCLDEVQKFDWNQSKAAHFLDISRRTLIYRMEKHGIHRDDAVPKA